MTIPEDPVAYINEMRKKVLGGETLSLEESKKVVRLMREQRAAKIEKVQKQASLLPADLNDLFAKKK